MIKVETAANTHPGHFHIHKFPANKQHLRLHVSSPFNFPASEKQPMRSLALPSNYPGLTVLDDLEICFFISFCVSLIWEWIFE